MSSVGYKVDTSAAVALSAATARTALMVITPAQFGGVLTHFTYRIRWGYCIRCPGVLGGSSFYERLQYAPGTGNTTESANIVQVRGRSITTGFTAFSASTSEQPTVLTRLDGNLLTPNGGLLVYDFPLGREFECDVSAGLGVRLTAPATVNARVSVQFERL